MANDPNWNLPDVPTFTLESDDFAEGTALPHWARSGIAGAGGEDRSPELHWSGAPAEAKSFVVTCFDPDAPTGSGFWHWAVYNLPASTTSLPQNAGDPAAGLLPDGARTVLDEMRLPRYLGAAPPPGHGSHRYFFTVTALDVETLDVDAEATPGVLGFNVFGHAIARAQLMGTSSTPNE